MIGKRRAQRSKLGLPEKPAIDRLRDQLGDILAKWNRQAAEDRLALSKAANEENLRGSHHCAELSEPNNGRRPTAYGLFADYGVSHERCDFR